MLDPFCGGGSIPLEAQRLGLEAHASDLNPVAVLITKALIEIPPKFAEMPPVNPEDRRKMGSGAAWKRAAGLAADVRYYGKWMRDEAYKRIGHLYPRVKLPPEQVGGEATVIAWLWARTVKCPNPACGAQMPLVRSFALSTKKGKEAWVEPVVDHVAKTVRFEVRSGTGKTPQGTVNRKGARCIVCNSPVPFDHVRREGRAGRMAQRLMATVVEEHGRRTYLPPDETQARVGNAAEPVWAPEAELPHNPRDFKTPNYGMTRFADLFTARQLVSLSTFSDLVIEAREQMLADAQAIQLSVGEPLREGGTGAAAYADALATYLAFGVDKMADTLSTLCTWQVDPPRLRATFGRQALPMTWDFAETNVFADAAGDYQRFISSLCEVLDRLVLGRLASVHQGDASVRGPLPVPHLVSTDPPYYDNIGYADLSDFFYVWLRRSLHGVFPGILDTMLTPKAMELVATPYRFGGSRKDAEEFFEHGLERSFSSMCRSEAPDYPLTVYYAFKQAELDSDGPDGTAMSSTGWETMLDALLHAGLSVVGT